MGDASPLSPSKKIDIKEGDARSLDQSSLLEKIFHNFP